MDLGLQGARALVGGGSGGLGGAIALVILTSVHEPIPGLTTSNLTSRWSSVGARLESAR